MFFPARPADLNYAKIGAAAGKIAEAMLCSLQSMIKICCSGARAGYTLTFTAGDIQD